MKLNKEIINKIINALDDYGREVNMYEYGLPTIDLESSDYGAKMREIIFDIFEKDNKDETKQSEACFNCGIDTPQWITPGIIEHYEEPFDDEPEEPILPIKKTGKIKVKLQEPEPLYINWQPIKITARDTNSDDKIISLFNHCQNGIKQLAKHINKQGEK